MFIFKYEIKQSIRTIIFSIILLTMFCLSILSKADTFVKEPSGLKIIDSLPKVLKIIYGINDYDLSTYQGYYGISFSYLILIFSLIFSFNIINRMNNDRVNDTMEYTYSKPIKRSKIFLIKLVASYTVLILMSLMVYIFIYLYALKYNDDNLIKIITIIHLNTFLISLIIGNISTTFYLLSLKFNKHTLIIGIVTFAMFFLLSFDKINGFFTVINYINPFKLVTGYQIIANEYHFMKIILILLVTFIAMFISLNIVKKKLGYF